MNRIIRAAIASTAVAATVLMPVAGAFAGERHYRDRGQHSYRYDRQPHHYRGHGPVIVHRDNSGAAIAAGILGLAVGAIIAGANSAPPPPEPYRPSRPSPHRDYFPDAPGYGPTAGSYYSQPVANIAEPWTPAWYRYCADRFRSFDAQTGTYLGYDGKRHFCVVK